MPAVNLAHGSSKAGRGVLFEPLKLPCGASLESRIEKSAMSDLLGDGTGHSTPEQIRLYQRWAQGGVAVSIIGEVQGNILDYEARDKIRTEVWLRHFAHDGLGQT